MGSAVAAQPAESWINCSNFRMDHNMSRVIKTKYWVDWRARKEDTIRVNSSTDANRAVAQCIMHMQVGDYGAAVAEVWDSETDVLHAQIKRHANGNITIVYKRDPQKFDVRFSTEFMRRPPKGFK